MKADPALIWAYLTQGPLLWLTATLAAYALGEAAFRASGRLSWANPVLIAVILLGLLLTATGTPYGTYFEGAQFVHFLLGPATVALAVPLYMQWKHLRRMALPLLVALLAGSAAAAFSAMGIASWLGASPETVRSLAPKSVTTPIAMAVAEQIGGLPSLTAVLVVITGITGTLCFPAFFRLLKIRNPAAQGFAAGLSAHGLGTARAFLISEEVGAFAALGMGLNGIVTAVFLPLLLR